MFRRAGLFVSSTSGATEAVFASQTARSRITLSPVFRFNIFNVRGKTYLSPEPRLSARYALENGLALKAGYSRMSQSIHLLSSTQLTLPMDLWVPATETLRPMTSDQFSLGCYYGGLEGWEFSLEGYYKSMGNILGTGVPNIYCIFSDRKFENEAAVVNVSISKKEVFSTALDYEVYLENDIVKTTHWLDVSLGSISKEEYDYLSAISTLKVNDFDSSALMEDAVIPNNVNGGEGFVTAYVETVSTIEVVEKRKYCFPI